MSKQSETRTTYYPVKLQRRLEACKAGSGCSEVVGSVCNVIQPVDQLFQLTTKCLCRQINHVSPMEPRATFSQAKNIWGIPGYRLHLSRAFPTKALSPLCSPQSVKGQPCVQGQRRAREGRGWRGKSSPEGTCLTQRLVPRSALY